MMRRFPRSAWFNENRALRGKLFYAHVKAKAERAPSLGAAGEEAQPSDRLSLMLDDTVQ